MSNPWFRMYHEFATDPKVQMLSEADQRRYVMLLCLRCSNEGVTLHDDEVAFLLRISNEEWQATKVVLLAKNLIDEDNLPVNWDKRQFKSDNSTERVRRCRKRKKERELALEMASDAARETDGNACNVTVTPPDTETDTDTYNQDAREINDRARDAVSELLEKSSAEGRAPPGATSKQRTGKFLMAEDWEPSDSYLGLQVAAGHDPKDLDWIVSEFVDYWTFTPDKNHLRDQTGWELLLSAQIKLKSKPKTKGGHTGHKKTQNSQSSGENRHYGARLVQSAPKAWSQAYRAFDSKKPEPVTEEVRRRTQAAQAEAMAKLGKLTGSRSARGANP